MLEYKDRTEYFSFKHNLHLFVIGLKDGARSIKSHIMSCSVPLSFSSQMMGTQLCFGFVTLVPGVTFVSIPSVLECVSCHPCVSLLLPRHSFLDCGFVHYTVGYAPALPLILPSSAPTGDFN